MTYLFVNELKDKSAAWNTRAASNSSKKYEVVGASLIAKLIVYSRRRRYGWFLNGNKFRWCSGRTYPNTAIEISYLGP